MASSWRIVFLGTPDFAVSTLRALHEGGFQVVGVVTAPDKPAGRGHKLQAPPVKRYAEEHDLPLLQPTNLKDPVFVEALRAWNADVQVVVAFRMLPEVVWNMPPHGTINAHASLLPQYRGAAPINRAIMNGERESGVTTFRLQHAIDTGGVLLREPVAIAPEDNAGTLHDKLMGTAATLIVRTLQQLEAGTLTETPQQELITDDEPLREAPKLFKEDCRINWEQEVELVSHFIRGLSPYPGAFTTLTQLGKERVFKVFEARVNFDDTLKSGSWNTDGKSWLQVGCKGGSLDLMVIQLEGKKRMSIEEFLRGFTFTEDTQFL